MSLVVHAIVLGALVWTVGSGIREPALDAEPMIYIDPAPPPAAGGPAESSAASTPPERLPAEIPAPIVAPEALVAPRVEPPRLRRVAPKAPPSRVAPESRREAASPGQADGVPGGAPGGVAGGLPGGTGTQAIPVALAGRSPIVVTRVIPPYPALARQRHIEGVVVLRAVIDTTGHVTRVQVVESVALLDDAAVRAFQQWRFTPGRNRDGEVVPVVIDVPMRFKIDQAK